MQVALALYTLLVFSWQSHFTSNIQEIPLEPLSLAKNTIFFLCMLNVLKSRFFFQKQFLFVCSDESYGNTVTTNSKLSIKTLWSVRQK